MTAKSRRQPKLARTIDEMLREVMEHPENFPAPTPLDMRPVDEVVNVGQNYTTYGAGEVPIPFGWPSNAKLG